jgi:hypothetical protein
MISNLTPWDPENISEIELDWKEGVFTRSAAVPGGDPRVNLAVYHEARCLLCEWAYNPEARQVRDWPGHRVVFNRFETPDVCEVWNWAAMHRAEPTHIRALSEFRRKKSI